MSQVRAYDKEEYGYRKAAVTRARTPIERKITQFKDVDTIENKKIARELDRALDKLKNAIKDYEDNIASHEKWLNHQQQAKKAKNTVLDPKYAEAFAEFEKDFETYRDGALKVIEDAESLLQTYYDQEMPIVNEDKNASVKAETLGANFNDDRVPTKMSTLLAPKPLEATASKSQYSVFKDKFNAHFGLNNIHLLALPAQKAFLFQYLDDTLIQRVQVQFSRHTIYSIFQSEHGVPSVFSFLDGLFEASDPLIVRRNKYFSCKQGKHEKNLEFFNRLQKCELEAECGQIEPREIFISLLMIGLNNESIVKEITKLGEEPDLDDVKRIFVQDENISTLSGVTNPHVQEMEAQLPQLSQLSNYRKNVNLRLNNPRGTGRGSYPGRGGSHSNRGNRQPQNQPQNSQRSSSCMVRENGIQCGFDPFWHCFKHSRITQAHRKELDKKRQGQQPQTNQMSVFEVAASDDQVWQDSTVPVGAELNLMQDTEILEIPVAVQTLSNGRELPMNFWHPVDPYACPRIYCKVAPAIDGQEMAWINVCTLPDTGCQRAVINAKIVHDNGWEITPLSPRLGLQDVVGAGGHSLGCIGKVNIIVEYFGHRSLFEASVCTNLTGAKQLYLGWKEMIDLGILPPEYPAPLNLSSGKPVRQPNTTLDVSNARLPISREVTRAWNIQIGDQLERWTRMHCRPGNGADAADHFWVTNFGIPEMLTLEAENVQVPVNPADIAPVQAGAGPSHGRGNLEQPPFRRQKSKAKDTLEPQPILHPPDVQVVSPPRSMDQSVTEVSSDEILEMKSQVRESVQNLMKEYDDVFDIKNLKSLKGPKMRIVLREDVPIVPNYVNGSKATPYNLIDEANKELESYLSSKIISRIQPGERTRWLNAAMFLPKPNGGVRLVVDLRILNSMAKRDVHCFQSPMEILKSVPPNQKFFAVIDAYRGYYQCDLHEDDQDLTAFILKDFGTFKFTKIPQGYKSSGDHFCKLSDLVIRDVPNCRKLVDDILIFAETKEELLSHLRILFQECRRFNLTLNPNKTQIGPEVTFGGYVLNSNGIKIDPKRVKAIREFKIPETITDVRSFMGLCLQFKHHTPELMKNLAPIIALTSTKTTPTDPENKEELKKEIQKNPINPRSRSLGMHILTKHLLT